MKKDIRDIPPKELERQIILMGEPPHRARQIFAWLNRKNVGAFREMTDLPRGLVTRLEEKFVIGTLACEKRLIARDGTEKFLWRLADGRHVETVFIRSGKRGTVCLSTQVGCRFACPFCASGMRGFKRNLTSGEIVEQLLLTQRSRGDRVTNVVFMGMGEPLDNYDNLIQAIRTINDPKGLNIGARKITISTCGIIPGILKLKDLGLQVELSVSLHAADDALRNELVPVNRKYPIGELVEALREYYESTNRVITLEYTLIKDKNDSLKNADKLAKIAKTLRAKVNIITYNPFAESACGKTDRRKMELFRDRLRSKGVTATVRSPRGQDIMAACGQLAAKGKRHEV